MTSQVSRLLRRYLMVAFAASLAACTRPVLPPEPQAGTPVPAGVPEAYYQQLQARGGQVLRVDPQRSLVVIEVHRAGSMAHLGHDHVVASHDLSGYVAPAEGRADLQFPADRLQVDESSLRLEAGLDTQPSAEAIEGTRRNMLEKVLEAERFPVVLIHARSQDSDSLKVSLTVHGRTREWSVPATIEPLADGMAVSGRLAINQSDFGIVPFSVLGGALQVRDRLDMRFRIVAAGP